MKRLDKLIEEAHVKNVSRSEAEKRAVYNRMTLEQLHELACGNPTDERIREILTSVDGLYLLGGD